MKHYRGGHSSSFSVATELSAVPNTAILQRVRDMLFFIAPTPELGLAAIFAFTALIISLAFGLPFVFPNSEALGFMGMSYYVPFGIIGAWATMTLLSKRRLRLFYYFAATFSYAVVLIAHFNVKQWMSLVNPRIWDRLFWDIDQAIRPVIDASYVVHNAVDWAVPAGNYLYAFAFLGMFVSSIVVHSMRCFLVFRKVIFSAMLVHVLGALSYLIMPAVGPFIYEAGANALETARQAHMYGGYQALLEGGRPWIAEKGGQHMFAAVAAMPSLHVASSAVFVYYAWRHERWLGLCYLPLFGFIVMEAMATRWHYFVDIPAGLAVSALAIWICLKVFKPIEAHHGLRQQSGLAV